MTLHQTPRARFVGLLVIAAALFVVAWLLWPRHGGGPTPLPEMSDAELIDAQLPQRLHDGAVWSELSRRFQAGGLDAAAVDRSVVVLVERLPALGWDRWLDALVAAQPYLDQILQAGRLSPETSLAFHRAFYSKPPRILPIKDLRAGDPLRRIDLQAGNSWRLSPHLAYGLVFDVVHVDLDGRPIEPDSVRHSADVWSGRTRLDLSPGPHRVVARVDAALVERAHLADRITEARPRHDWPPTVVEWTAEAAAGFDVLPPSHPAEP